MQDKIYTNLLQVDIMQLYKHLKESMQKWDMMTYTSWLLKNKILH